MNSTNPTTPESNTSMKYDVIIIGGGPAGLTAGIYTSRANLKTLILAGSSAGGQLMLTSEVENFPGFPQGVMGPQLMASMKDQALRFNTEYLEEDVKSVAGNAQEGFQVVSTNDKKYLSKTIIVATGASAKWLPLESVTRLRSRGVSACATCDGFFFKDKVVAVVGAGDTAIEESTYLTKFASKVYLLVRGSKEKMRASKIMQDRAFQNSKIEFLFNTELDEVLGDNLVSGIRIKNNLDNSTKVLEDVKGVFMAIGHKPNTDFLVGLVDLNEVGYIKPIENTKTNVEGLFVAGDVSDWKYRQAVSAAGLGCMAALDVEKYLASKE